MRHHQQRQVGAGQIVLQPLNHLQVQVVGRLVQNQEVRLRDEHIGQGHTLQLSAGELRERLFEVADLQFGEDGLRTTLVVPCPFALHAVQDGIQSGMSLSGHALLVLADKVRGVVAVPETGLYHGQFPWIHRLLWQIAHPQTVVIDHTTLVCTVRAGQYI